MGTGRDRLQKLRKSGRKEGAAEGILKYWMRVFAQRRRRPLFIMIDPDVIRGALKPTLAVTPMHAATQVQKKGVSSLLHPKPRSIYEDSYEYSSTGVILYSVRYTLCTIHEPTLSLMLQLHIMYLVNPPSLRHYYVGQH